MPHLPDMLRAMLRHERAQVQPATPVAGVATALGALALGELALGEAGIVVPDVDPLRLRAPSVHRALLAYALSRLGRQVAGVDALYQEGSSGPAACALHALALERGGQYTGFFRDLADRQQPTGQFLPQDPYASPDLHWFDELVLLHAMASHVSASQPAPLNSQPRAALLAAVRFHTNETQPDHATTHPWGLHAFALTEDGHQTATLLLHATQSQNAGRLDPISQLLIADALLGLDGGGVG
jgi:hypothetical protein